VEARDIQGVIMLKEKDFKRFCNKISIDNNTDCWNWTGGTTQGGYGIFRIDNQTINTVHRISYQYFYDIDPGKLLVCHTCDNPKCANPNHLFLGTQTKNMIDMMNKERCGISKLTNEDVKVMLIDIYNGKYSNTTEIANVYNVKRGTIRCILNGQRWTHITDQLQVPLSTIKQMVRKTYTQYTIG